MDDEKEIIEEGEGFVSTSEEDSEPEIAEESTEAEEESAEEEEPAEDGDEGISVDDLEYDEDGNAIIPEGIEDEDTSAEDEGNEESKGSEKEADSDVNTFEAENKALREELLLLKTQSEETLKLLGIESDNPLEGLTEFAAEIEGVSPEEYRKKRDDIMRKKMNEKAEKVVNFERIAANDLAELQAEYPDTKKYKHVRDMPSEVLKKFADLRNIGVNAVDAYAAANRNGIRKYAATSAKKATSNGKEHLQSSIPKASKNNAPRMTRADLEYWRGMFPKKSDKEIVALYRKTY